jgi:hypothetical protein
MACRQLKTALRLLGALLVIAVVAYPDEELGLWLPDPHPGGSADANKAQDEGKIVSYQIKAKDYDTWSPSGNPDDPRNAIHGDNTVWLDYVGEGSKQEPPMATLADPDWLSNGFDPQTDTITFEMRVKLHMIPNDDEEMPVVHRYASRDSRGPMDPRWDWTWTPFPPASKVTFRWPLDQGITIRRHRGTVKGTVTNNQGQPVQFATVTTWSLDPEMTQPWTAGDTTDQDGHYTIYQAYAGRIRVQAESGMSGATVDTDLSAGGTAQPVDLTLQPY